MTPGPADGHPAAGDRLATSAPSHGFVEVYADADLVVACKPSGLLSVPGRGEHGADCLAARVRAVHADALVVHRLDMSTSGLMLFARGPEAQRALSRAFAERRVEKRYLAIVAGRPEPADGTIELPLSADWPNRPRQRVDPLHGKPSVTHYRTLAVDLSADTARVALEPVTGRAHQLRVHLAATGHPILGDALYAPPTILAAASRLLLHAETLAFEHPRGGRRLGFAAVAPF